MNENKNINALQVETCPATGYLPASICTGVTVTPFATPGVTTTFCCGDPVITPGTAVCPGELNGSCSFTISQNICVAVPVEFGASTQVGETYVQCGTPTNVDVCTNCSTAGETPSDNSSDAASTNPQSGYNLAWISR